MPRFTKLKDELYVGGVALSDIDGMIVEDYPFFASSVRRGQAEVIPGVRGQRPIPRPLDSFTFSIPVSIVGDNPDGTSPTDEIQLRANFVRNLGRVTGQLSTQGGVVSLRRALQGEEGPEYSIAVGEFVQGTSMTFLNPYTGQTELEFINHSGVWYSEEEYLATSGSFTVGGQYPTRRITLVLPSGGTLTNNIGGGRNVWVTVPAACTLDVESFGSTIGTAAISNGGDNKWFILYHGLNQVSWTGTGNPAIHYRTAQV